MFENRLDFPIMIHLLMSLHFFFNVTSSHQAICCCCSFLFVFLRRRQKRLSALSLHFDPSLLCCWTLINTQRSSSCRATPSVWWIWPCLFPCSSCCAMHDKTPPQNAALFHTGSGSPPPPPISFSQSISKPCGKKVRCRDEWEGKGFDAWRINS